jgi:hypothetical protein
VVRFKANISALQTGFWDMEYVYGKVRGHGGWGGLGVRRAGFFRRAGAQARSVCSAPGLTRRRRAPLPLQALEGVIQDGVGLGYPGGHGMPRRRRLSRHAQRLMPSRPSRPSPSTLNPHPPPPPPPPPPGYFALPSGQLDSDSAWSRFVRAGRIHLRCEILECE